MEVLGVSGPEGHGMSRPAVVEGEATGRAIRCGAEACTVLYLCCGLHLEDVMGCRMEASDACCFALLSRKCQHGLAAATDMHGPVHWVQSSCGALLTLLCCLRCVR